MKVVDIANEIFLENSASRDTSITAIAFWIRTNVGKLNTLLYEDFYVDPTTLEIFHKERICNTPEAPYEINIVAVAIIKNMYKVYRAELDIRALINSLTNDTILEASDEGFTVKKLNRSEILKTFTQLKKDALKELTDLVHYYRSLHGPPSQVSGDDTVPGYFPGFGVPFSRVY